MTDTVIVDRKFAIIDEWVLNLPISDRALRLYVLLVRYADNHTHRAFPSRETLATRMDCSKASVDRATQELIDHGAISKSQRMNSSLVYTVHVTKGVVTPDEGGSSPVMRGVVTDDDLTRTTELEPENIEPLNNQSSVIKSFDEFWDTYPKHLQKGEARFIPYPATWLNRDGWDDEPFPPREGIPGVTQGLPKSPHVGGPRDWVRDMHDMGEHWECRPGEFGCK